MATLWDFYQQHSHPLVLPLWAISQRGVRVDVALRRAATTEYEAQEVQQRASLNALTGQAMDPLSSKQLMDWVYAVHNIKPVQRQRKTVTGERTSTQSLDEAAIKELQTRALPEQVKQVLVLVLAIRSTHKILQTYLKAPLDKDHRLRCSYAITGTKTGRLSSRETPLGTGTNLQNVPPGIARRLVVPDDGLVFVAADLSQAEARVVAYLARETRLIAVFDQGGDLHRRNAATIFRLAEEAVSPTQRYLAKRVVHATHYGMGARTFAEDAGITKPEAQRLLYQYFNTYPRIKAWHLEVEEQLRASRILETPLGRRRQFFGAWNSDLLREAYAYIPQSTVSDILNDGLIQYTQEGAGQVVLQVHDSIVVQVPRQDQEACFHDLQRCLVRPLEIHGRTCTIPIDITAGQNWDELHPI